MRRSENAAENPPNIGAKAFDKLFAKPVNSCRRALFAGLFDIVNWVESITRPREREAKPAPGSSTQLSGTEGRPGIVARLRFARGCLFEEPASHKRRQYVKRHLRRERHLWQIRHCERSEAIQSDPRSRNEICAAKLDCFVAEPVIGPATSCRTRWPGEGRLLAGGLATSGKASVTAETSPMAIGHLWQVVIYGRTHPLARGAPLQNANKRMLNRSVTYAEFCHLWQKSKT